MCLLSRLYENEQQKHAKLKDTIKSNEILEEETQYRQGTSCQAAPISVVACHQRTIPSSDGKPRDLCKPFLGR